MGGITGRLFASLIQLSLRTYAAVNGADLSYLKTRNGDHEIDFIMQKGRSVIAIEVKMAQEISDSDVKHIKWLRNALKEELTDAIVINTGPAAYRRGDGIAVVPAALLGA
jgi:predicted AAA+ superfamily ATPase